MSARRLTLILCAMCLATPLQVWQHGQVEVALTDVVAVMSLLLVAGGLQSREVWLLVAAATAATVSGLWTASFVAHEPSMRWVLSVLYFFKPYALFIAGFVLVRSRDDLRRCWVVLAHVGTAVALVIALPLLATGGVVRLETLEGGMLRGSLLGLPLYGLFGVNALVVYYTTMLGILLSAAMLSGRSALVRLWWLSGVGALAYMILGSASRQAMLGLLAFLVFFTLGFLRLRPRRAGIVVVVAGVAAVLVVLTAGHWVMEQWGFKIARDIQALGRGNWVALSAGRLILYGTEVSDIMRSPVFGVGFHGFQLYHDAIPLFPYVVGLSPHSQFLGAIWKMGLLGATLYAGFLISGLLPVYRLWKRGTEPAIASGLLALVGAFFVVFAILQDVLTFPLTGGLLMFLLGACARVVRMPAGAALIETPR